MIKSINSTTMEPGKHYIVTKSSIDGSFQAGDHIYMYPSGNIECSEAHGCMFAENVPEATKGMKVIWDVRYYNNK